MDGRRQRVIAVTMRPRVLCRWQPPYPSARANRRFLTRPASTIIAW